MDFSERVTPKLRRLLERERRAAGQERAAQGHEVCSPEPEAQMESSIREDNQASTCMEMVVWSGDGLGQAGASATDVPRLSTTSSAASPAASFRTSPASIPSSSSETATAAKSCAPQARSSWKPPGCLRQSLWKRPIKPVKKSRAPAPRPPAPVTVDPCPTCASIAEEKDSLHHHQQALHLKTIKVESLASKCAREMKAFEAYKEEELKRLSELKEAFKLKKKRDALAQTAEARTSSQHTDLARMRIKVEEVEAALATQRLKSKTDKDKYAAEIQRYREEIHALKDDVRELHAALAGASKARTGAMATGGTNTDSRLAKRSSDIGTPSTPGDCGTHVTGVRADYGDNGGYGDFAESRKRERKEGTVRVHENNTVETRWDDGAVQYVYENGDVRQSYVHGIVEYLYADIECWNTCYPDGDHVYYFKDGRRECHHTDGTVQILVDGRRQAYGCCRSERSGQQAAASIPEEHVNPKLYQACPDKL